ncbi:MAG: T9SS type A sorting domain-containing protein [Flavobacteriales bacterium]|nr:T9SS type A sorting domain-containing protein [Flavobacteriales bacterium]
MRKELFTCFTLLLAFVFIDAQEVEVDLPHNAIQAKEYAQKRSIRNTSRSLVSLPFIDDFSIDKFPGNLAGNQVLWETGCSWRNETFAVNAPTLGVATFDGLDCTGYPYNFESANSFGSADTLTSTDIDLSSASGNIVLSFLYQAQGWGNQPESSDSLVLEFWAPDSLQWYWAWSSPGKVLDDFEMVLISIENDQYLKPDFKFRFRNYATLSGALDHWNLDYIELDDNRSLDDTIIQDLAFFEPQYTLLNGYSSVPWSHYSESLMRSDILGFAKNNGNNGSFMSNNTLEIFENGISQGISMNFTGEPSVSAGSVQGYNYGVTDDGLSYGSSFSGEITFDVEFSFTVSPDFVVDNNVQHFQQTFTDYYAYDDGSAERGYGVDIAGGQVAYRFDVLEADSIAALYMYFLPVAEDPSEDPFYLTIWSHNDLLNCPDTIIHQDNIAAPSSTDYQTAHDYFLVYPLQEKIGVNANESVWIGWVQSGDVSLNIGNDKNTNNNIERLKYNVAGAWNSSIIPGSLMMRPAFGEIPVVSIDEPISEMDIKLYPNPTKGLLFLDLPDMGSNWRYDLFGLQGNIIASEILKGNKIDLADDLSGMYYIRFQHPSMEKPITKKIIVVR